jgi:hypothetical protein
VSRECDQSWCDRKHYAKGYCFAHYKRMRAGSNMDARFQARLPDEEKFWERVRKSDGCWEWTAGKAAAGYGIIRYRGTDHLAHRVSYELKIGPIPEGMQIDHKCHNRACVNPEHLRIATDGLNQQNRSGATRASKSGVRGVTWYEPRGKWMAKAQLVGKQYFLGYFDSIEAATTAVTDWRREHMPYSINDQRKAV